MKLSSRKPLVGGNWKMNLNEVESHALARSVSHGITNPGDVDVVLFPAFPYLIEVANVLKKVAGSGVRLGAQDFYYQSNGAYTGEVSLTMLKDVGAKVVLVGHSERRHVIAETDDMINRKVRGALDAGFEVMLCVGEKLEQREAGMTNAINWGQLAFSLAGVKPEQMTNVSIAYEPVWAIGTGRTATPADAQAAHQAIRNFITFGLFNNDVGQALRILYGGSVKPSNAKELFAQPDIDGGLIGGASLVGPDFLAIINAATA